MITSTFDPARPLARLPLQRHLVTAGLPGWMYAHHAHLARLGDRLVALWSNGRRDEDAQGQRVLVSDSPDGRTWSEPRVVAEAWRTADGTEEVALTACGLHVHAGTLVAYIGSYRCAEGEARPIAEVHLHAMTTTDLCVWSPLRDLGLPVIPNHGPQATASGRLVIAGNTAFPWTDDPAGLTGWRMAGFYPADRADFHDDPGSFWRVREWTGLPVALCEGAFEQTDDGVLRMLLRGTGHAWVGRLWATASTDDGATWSRPEETGFTDADTKFHLGRLPDGRFYHVGTPDPARQHVRSNLILSLSHDGRAFDSQYLIADEPYPQSAVGRSKHGEYGYPHSVVDGDRLRIIVSRQKEAIEVLEIRLADIPARK